VRGASNAAELHVTRGGVGADVEGEDDREELLVLVPVDGDVDVETGTPGA
jgi:hypothetical protein